MAEFLEILPFFSLSTDSQSLSKLTASTGLVNTLIHSYIQYSFIEHLFCTRHCSIAGNKVNKVFILMEFIF